ncbi:hypothetical protein [Sphingomonas sp. M1-B02]|uniref:hypothetical protein n=1 Tax=Sphingomonas sp. M1-B02 TaxID=3114300 RepID=UPI00223F8302|nr:hypothetical protein [Sphingomonas sp. S6-11]UZK67476.1 hypothetical protein OKW87_06490 [Sphingomonas sp. S6-11]
MKVGKPDPQTAMAPEPTLAQRIGERARGWRAYEPARGGDRRLAVAVALLIAAAPVLTISGGTLLAGRERAATTRIEAALAPRIAAERTTAQARIELEGALRRPSLAATVEMLARALPTDATLVRAERTREGVLEFDVASPDPDLLRAALRRTAGLARARSISERPGESGMIVSFRGGAE